MAQTYHRGVLVAPSGHRLVVASGTHAFSTAATSVTLTVKMRKLVAAHASPNQVLSSTKTGMVGSWIPYISSTNLSATGISPYGKVIVKRKTGSISALKFSYTFVGY
jgi:hypothetical protein